MTMTIKVGTNARATLLSHMNLYDTCDYILVNVHYCVLFSSMAMVRIRVRIRFSAMVGKYYLVLTVVNLTLPRRTHM